jgi:hypothetical protein
LGATATTVHSSYPDFEQKNTSSRRLLCFIESRLRSSVPRAIENREMHTSEGVQERQDRRCYGGEQDKRDGGRGQEEAGEGGKRRGEGQHVELPVEKRVCG